MNNLVVEIELGLTQLSNVQLGKIKERIVKFIAKNKADEFNRELHRLGVKERAEERKKAKVLRDQKRDDVAENEANWRAQLDRERALWLKGRLRYHPEDLLTVKRTLAVLKADEDCPDWVNLRNLGVVMKAMDLPLISCPPYQRSGETTTIRAYVIRNSERYLAMTKREVRKQVLSKSTKERNYRSGKSATLSGKISFL